MSTDTSQNRRKVVPPKDAEAEQACLLDKEMLASRTERPDDFLGAARTQATLPNGGEFRFAAAPGMWERVETFVSEERECCPFFAFELWEEAGDVVLQITRPAEAE